MTLEIKGNFLEIQNVGRLQQVGQATALYCVEVVGVTVGGLYVAQIEEEEGGLIPRVVFYPGGRI